MGRRPGDCPSHADKVKPNFFSHQYAFSCIPHVPPLLFSHSIASQRPDLVGQAHMESYGNAVNDIHVQIEAKQLRIKGGDWPNFHAGPL